MGRWPGLFLWVDGLHMVLIVGIIFFKFLGGNYRVRGLVVPLFDAFGVKCTWIGPSNSSVTLIGIDVDGERRSEKLDKT